MYFISNIFLRIRGGSKSSCTNAIFFALVQELIDRDKRAAVRTLCLHFLLAVKESECRARCHA